MTSNDIDRLERITIVQARIVGLYATLSAMHANDANESNRYHEESYDSVLKSARLDEHSVRRELAG